MTAVNPRIDVVIVTWNSEGTITDCLESVYAQEGVQAFPIVVDNDSTDNTVDRIAGKAEVIANSTNTGYAVAANQGARRGSSAYLLFLNPDALLSDPCCLLKGVRILESDAQIGSLGGLIRFPDGVLQPSAFAPPDYWREFLEASYLYRLVPARLRGRLLLGPHWTHDSTMDVGWLLGAFVLCRRSTYERVGGLTEDFHLFSEDLDWGRQVAARGLINRFDPSLELVHVSNHSGAIRWGVDRSEISFRAYYDYLRTRRGRTRERFSVVTNLIGFCIRSALYSGKALSGSPEAIAWKDEYRRLVKMHWRWMVSSRRVSSLDV
jgi:GT2 family glycosyltransferase